MRTLYKITNIVLIIAMIACCAGALAGLIVFLPFVAGAWALNLVGLLAAERAATEQPRPRPAAADAVARPVTTLETRTSAQPPELRQAA